MCAAGCCVCFLKAIGHKDGDAVDVKLKQIATVNNWHIKHDLAIK